MKFIVLFVVLVAFIATQAVFAEAKPAAPTWEGNGSPLLSDPMKAFLGKMLDLPDEIMMSSGSGGLGSGLMF